MTPETLDEILEHKSIKEKQTELDAKLDQLARKRLKDLGKLESSKTTAEEKLTRVPSRTKNPLHIIKKFSTVNLEGTPSPDVGVRSAKFCIDLFPNSVPFPSQTHTCSIVGNCRTLFFNRSVHPHYDPCLTHSMFRL